MSRRSEEEEATSRYAREVLADQRSMLLVESFCDEAPDYVIVDDDDDDDYHDDGGGIDGDGDYDRHLADLPPLLSPESSDDEDGMFHLVYLDYYGDGTSTVVAEPRCCRGTTLTRIVVPFWPEDVLRDISCEVDDARACLVCMERLIAARFKPCGHEAACRACANALVEKSPTVRVSCPLCRGTIETTCDLDAAAVERASSQGTRASTVPVSLQSKSMS